MRTQIRNISFKNLRFYSLLFLILLSNAVHAQFKVTGLVKSMSTGEPLKDIEVKLTGVASDPVYTGAEGEFELTMPEQSSWIDFTYAGYKKSVKFVQGGDQVEVYMVDNNEYSIEDKIAIPLGEIKDKLFTGSRSYINHEQLNASIYPSFESRIDGMASGVRVLNNSGTPGSGSTLLIRGISTIFGGTQPLYVVDGLVLRNYQYSNPLSAGAYNNPLADLNPNDLRSVTIIKDGAQSAFYGVRGGNGVVLIETNLGTTGKTTLTLDAYTGVALMPKVIPMLNASEYSSYFKDLNYKNGMSPYEFGLRYGKVLYHNPNSQNYYRYNNDNNWQDIISDQGVVQNYYLNLKGGDQVTTYAFSTGLLNQKGFVTGTNFQRFTIDFNLLYRISDKMRFGNVVNFCYADRSIADEGINVHSNPLFISLVKAPQYAPQIIAPDGSVSSVNEDQDFFGMSNPSHVVSNLENKVGVNRLMGSIYLDFDLLKNLNGRVVLGVDYNRQSEKRFYPDYGLSTSQNADRFSESKVNNRFLLQGDAYLKYHKTFNNSHNIKMLAGIGVHNQNIDYTYGKSINSAADYFTTLAKGEADSLSSGEMVSRMVSAYAKINYDYQDKILLEANLRIDGSSSFGTNNRFGYFPGISAGWRLSEENFLKDVEFINELKIKAGYGVTGNENIEGFAAYNTYTGADYNLRGAIKPSNIGNVDLKWETNQQYDVGIQFMGARNRIGAEVDIYLKNTTDLFYFKELPSITGYPGILDNLGDIENKGIDISLFFRPVSKNLIWDLRLKVSKYKNTVTRLPGGEYTMGSDGFQGMAREGEALGVFYGYNAIGIFDNAEEAAAYQNSSEFMPFEAGDVKYEDLNDDGIINVNDMGIIGNPHPDYFGSILNTLSYKGWKMDLNLTYSVGNQAMNATRRKLESMSNYYNQTTAVINAWQREGDAASTNIPRIAMGDPAGNTRNSTRWLEDASFLRLQLLSLSYDVPETILGKIGMKALTVYLKGQNIYTFSKYLGYSPDFVSGYNPLLFGIDTGTYPAPRTFLIGVKLGL